MTDKAPPTSDDERIGVANDLGWDAAAGAGGYQSIEERARAFFTTERLASEGRELPSGLDQGGLDEIRDAVVRRAAAREQPSTEASVEAVTAEPDVIDDDPDALSAESFPASDPPGTY